MKTLHFILKLIAWPLEPKEFTVKKVRTYHSTRYNKDITPRVGFKCDGSSCSPNVGWGWLFHDWLFWWGKFDDGTPCTWRQANRIMKDVMQDEGWPKFVVYAYRKGIKSKHSLKAWKKHRAQDEDKH